MDKFVNRIIEHRKAKGLTQKQMADKLGLTQVGYSKIETGKTELTIERALKIAKLLDSDLLNLLYPSIDTDIEITNENEVLTTRLVEKDLLINSITNENKRLKSLLIAEIKGRYDKLFGEKFRISEKSKDESIKERMTIELAFIEKNKKSEYDFLIRSGILEQGDIEAFEKGLQEHYIAAMKLNNNENPGQQ